MCRVLVNDGWADSSLSEEGSRLCEEKNVYTGADDKVGGGLLESCYFTLYLFSRRFLILS